MALKLPARIIFACLVVVLVCSIYIHYDYRGILTNISLPSFDRGGDDKNNHDDSGLYNSSVHRKITSLSTPDGKWFKINWLDDRAYNPNILPHPTQPDHYIVAALQVQVSDEVTDSAELVCNAIFVDGTLTCMSTPKPLPIKPVRGQCKGELAFFNFRKGPRDARVFYGPDGPYIMYGSLGTRNCLGLYLQDLRTLLNDFDAETKTSDAFANGTELARPPPVNDVQKNWFIFWDAQNQFYVHHDIFPNRTFSQLSADGSVGTDLSVQAKKNDDACMARFMPIPKTKHEKVHQTTNSLAITLCKRSDPKCSPSDDNTFIMTIFHYQTFYDWHAQYYPHVMLFRRNSPFEVHAISQKPLWIWGKPLYTNESESVIKGDWAPEGHTDLFYVTSMSWKNPDQRYQGFIDDPLFISFGIEDTRSGAIDVTAGDMLKDLGFCADVKIPIGSTYKINMA
ncbi:hypothetical protein LTS17_000506 [Exophiala oligosperma]